MAGKRIRGLTEITTMADTDYVITDNSLDAESKKITKENLLKEIQATVDEKQDADDVALATTSKNIVGAINEVNTKTEARLKLDQTTPQTVTGGKPIMEGIQLDTTPTVGAFSEGKFYWDEINHCPAYNTNVNGVINQVGQEVHVRVCNNTGSTITNGSVVYISGANETMGLPEISLAMANDYAASRVIGMATADIATASCGIVTFIGEVNDLDTSGFSEGDVVFLSPTSAGQMTTTMPIDGNFVVIVGIITKIGTTDGSILVNPKASEFTTEALQRLGWSKDYGNATLSFSNATRILTLTPVGTTFHFYQYGVKYTKATDSIEIPNEEGLYGIYYNLGTLNYIKNPTNAQIDSIIKNNPSVAYIYWDLANQKAQYFGNELHDMQFPPSVHSYAHFAFGMRYLSGLGVTDVVPDALGNLDAHAQFGVLTGNVVDEDILFTTNTTTSTTGLPVYYLSGTSAAPTLRSGTKTGFSVLTAGTGRIAFNFLTGGNWTLAEATNGNFVLYHIFANNSNDPANRVVSVMGINQYASLSSAQVAAKTEIFSLQSFGLVSTELKSIATFVFETKDTFTNGVKGRIRSVSTTENYVDWRTVNTSGGGAAGSQTTTIFSDEAFQLFDNLDVTKTAKFQLTNLASGANRTYSLQDKTGTVAMTDDTTLASNSSIADAGNYYTGTNTEAALQEIGAKEVVNDYWNNLQDDVETGILSDTITTKAMTALTGTGLKNGVEITNPVSFKDGGARIEEKGLTLANLVTNGNFVNTTGWTAVNSSLSIANNTATITGNGSSNDAYISKSSVFLNSSHKYFIKAKARVTNSSCLFIQIGNYTGESYVIKSNPLINEWYEFYGIKSGYTNSQILLNQNYVDATTANGKVLEVQYVTVLDLTAIFGAGNEPTADKMNALMGAWFDGTVNVVNPALRTVGKNLASDVLYPASAQYQDTVRAKCVLKPSTSYTLSWEAPSGERYYENESLFTTSAPQPISSGTRQYLRVTTKSYIPLDDINIGNNGYYRIFKNFISTTASGLCKNFMISENTDYTYEAYKTNVLSYTGTLRSVVDSVSATNETSYTPSTWAEWVLLGSGSTKGSSGVHLVQDGGTDQIALTNRNFKVNTKYGILLNVTAKTFNGGFVHAGGGIVTSGTQILNSSCSIGNNKSIFTTLSSIAVNEFRCSLDGTNTDGTYIDFKDIRIIELPAGSQLEADFTNLTADQLAANIPWFSGTGTATLSTVLRDRLYPLNGKFYVDRYVNPSTGLKQTMATELATVTGKPYVYANGTSIIETSVIAPYVDYKISYADMWNVYTPTITWTTATPGTIVSRFVYMNRGRSCKVKGYLTSTDGNGATNWTITLPFNVAVGSGNSPCFMQVKVNTTWYSLIAQVVESTNLITLRTTQTLTDNVAAELEVYCEYEVA